MQKAATRTQRECLRIIPDAITFRDLKCGESDSVEVWATNVSDTPLSIRFTLPANCPFLLEPPQIGLIPPGLDTKATIKYTAKDAQKYSAELTVGCQLGSVKVPIIAEPPCSRIVADTQKIDIGAVGIGLSFKFNFTLTNIGVKDGPFSLVGSDDVEFVPSSGVILPSKTQEINCTFKPDKPGPFSFNIIADLQGKSEKIPPIEVSGTSVIHSLVLHVGGKEVRDIDFKTIFFGQKQIISATIVNTGPSKRSFVIYPPREEQSLPSGRSTFEQEDTKLEPIFSAEPSEGMLEAHGQRTVQFSFTPPTPKGPVVDDIDQIFTNYTTIEVVETGQHLEFTLTGKGVHQFTKMSSYDFVFDKSEVGVKQSKELVISNNSHFLPISYKVKPAAHFRFEPSSGTIQKNSKATVNVIFFPKNYGEFNFATTVSFCDGLIKKEINLSAVCGQITDKPFKRIPIYETEENARYSASHPDKRFSNGLEGIERASRLRERYDGFITESAEKRATISQLKTFRAKLKVEANNYLTNTLGTYTEDDVKEYIEAQMKSINDKVNGPDLGLEPFEGLEPPSPPIVNKPAPLYIENPERFGFTTQDNGSSGLNMKGRKVVVDDNVLIKKKFKPKPTTPAEINECGRILTPAQQLMVVASHQTLNFGQVSVFSTVAKSFAITNNLQQHILVTINYEFDELSKSTPATQIVLPKQTAGFDIKFSSKVQHNFTKAIQYTINNHHTYTFNVAAQVIPIDLQLSRQMIEFRFSPDSISPCIKEFVIIQNRSNAKAEYTWTGLTPVFSLSQVSGVIDPEQSQSIEITYTPTTRAHDETTLLLNVTGGATRSLKCIGDIGVPKCSIAKKVINFGLIPIGITKSQQVKVKNTGDDDAIFTLSHEHKNELQIIPMNGRIAAHDSQIFQLNFKSVQAAPFDIPVTIQIAGANSLSFNVTGQSELPRVQIMQNEFEFGRLFVGSSASLEGEIQNIGAIPAILFLDLSNHPDFRLEYSTELTDGNHGENENSITLVSDTVFVTKSEIKPIPSIVSKLEMDDVDELGDQQEEQGPGLVYKIYLVENSSIKFNLFFQPTEPNEYSFELPFTMMNIISASSFHLQPIVSAESIKAPLSLSNTSLDFGISPIFNPQNPHCRPVVRQLTLNNEYKENLPWHIDTSEEICGKPAAFVVEPSQGVILPGASILVHISFMARDANPYNIHLPVYVKTGKDKEESVVAKIQLTGVGTNKPFSMSQPCVSLPIVPLNVTSQAVVYVNNDAFIESTLRVQMASDEGHFPVKVTFPEGNHMLHTSLKIPVLVSFHSSKPLSFSTMVAIIDDNDNATSFSVSCTTDNSIFTLYPFFRGNDCKVKSQKGSPITIDQKVCDKATELTSRFSSASDYLDLKGVEWEASVDKRMIYFLQRYLNAILLNTQLSDFPNDFIRNDGALMIELVSNMSNGKRPPVESDRVTAEKPKTNESKHLHLMTRLIHFLQSMTCLISSVKPEFLLPRSEFLSVLRNRITKQLLGINYYNAPDVSTFNQTVISEYTASKSFSTALMQRMKVVEHLYEQLSIESWSIILLQLFKVFVVGKIDIERLQQSPGTADAIKAINAIASRFTKQEDTVSEIIRPPKSLQTSTVYNTHECSLLKWISIHTCSMYQDLQRSVNSFDSLRDSVSFTALLKAYTSVLKTPLPDPLIDHSSADSNSITFTSALKELKMAFCPHADEITKGSQCMLAIIAAYLFEILPKNVPVATLEFVTTLHKVVTKTVTIQNPSKAEITYKARLEGSHNFSLVTDTCVIPPGSSIEFPVTFSARTIKTQAGVLYFSPMKPRFVSTQGIESGQDSTGDTSRIESHIPMFSAPIVINLVTEVSIAAPDISVSVEGQIYQITQHSLQVKNFIGTKCKVNLSKRIFKIADENGKMLPEAKRTTQQIQSFITDTNENEASPIKTGRSNPFNDVIKDHQVFCFSENSLDFQNDNSTATFNVEFIPISLGTYRCLVLFQDENQGEFIIEIVGKSTLPNAIEVGQGKFKTESGKKIQYSIPVDPINQNLIKALAYSKEKVVNSLSYVSERKFKELHTRRIHEFEVLFKQCFSQHKYQIINSSTQYFDVQSELILSKPTINDNLNKVQINSVPIVFKPVKAGDYPLKIVLSSATDVRVFKINAVGLAALKEMTLEFSTVCGRSVKQDIPFVNTSSDVWNYKVQLTGDNSFSAPPRLSIKAKGSGTIPVTFSPTHVGTYKCELNVTNVNKESTTIYQITGKADEPPAEKSLQISCQARLKRVEQIDLKQNFIKSGLVKVTSTVPIITFKSEVYYENGVPKEPFKYTVYAPRSGLSVGTITFTDPITNNYMWYVIELHVDPPAPEQTIEITTTARKCSTVNIPIANTKDTQAKFSVVLSDEDLFGDKEFVVPPNSSANYKLVVSPLKAMCRNSSVYFYSDDDGEFWYGIKITATEPPMNTITPLTSPIGKHTSTFILLANPLSKSAQVRVENTNPTAFHVMSKRVLTLLPLEKKRIEVRYIPTTVGIKETAEISFCSTETGDWTYSLTGTGKPPQPMSPIIISSPLNKSSSDLVQFTNPIPYPARFSVNISSECDESVFRFLIKKKTFSLQQFGEEFQIPFTFTPNELGQFNAFIIVAFLGPARGQFEQTELPSIRWVFPVIGSSLSVSTSEVKHIRCRAMEKSVTQQTFILVGETETFKANEYSLKLDIPSEYEFLRFNIDLKATDLHITDKSYELYVTTSFSPMRPINTTAELLIRNPLGQEWKFSIIFQAERGKPIDTIVIESLLNKEGSVDVIVPHSFRMQTPFHAYLTASSAQEFTITMEHGYIEPAFGENQTKMPFQLVFCPKMYGKVFQGMLVVDTLDSQYIFEVVGKTPQYVPPVIKSGILNKKIQQESLRVSDLRMSSKRKARIVSPSAQAVRPPFK